MEQRKNFQGVINILRFNWHFYVFAFAVVVLLQLFKIVWEGKFILLWNILIFLTVAPTLLTVLVSWYVYDFSGLYNLRFLDDLRLPENSTIVNINAGFDETSQLIQNKYPRAKLRVFDFFDPEKNTEISIHRARKVYPPYPNTEIISFNALPLESNSVDLILLIFAAHEIRQEIDRNIFFKELKRVLKIDGRILLIEHLRDFPNFMAYNFGFFHFIPKNSWLRTFDSAGFKLFRAQKIALLVNCFTLHL